MADPTPQAVALRYSVNDAAPVLVARGRGVIAEAILARAREAGIAVHASADLVAFLTRVDLDQRIPPVLYAAVAEVLAWVHRIDADRAGDGGPA